MHDATLFSMIFILYVDTPINNERYICLRFEVKESYVLHGFAGYFDTLLYDDLTLSKLALRYHNLKKFNVYIFT